MEEVKQRFENRLETVLRVLASCRTIEQLQSSKKWGIEVIFLLADQIEKNGNFGERRFTKEYKLKVSLRITEAYSKKLTEIKEGLDRTITRRVPAHISICRSCSGVGKIFSKDKDVQPQLCPACLGTGKVKVCSTITTVVQPFITGEDDTGNPIAIS